MASLPVDDLLIDDDIDQTSELSDNSDNEEGMPHPFPLRICQPPILFEAFDKTPDQAVLEEIFSISQMSATQLQKAEVIQSKVRQLHSEAEFCNQEDGSENDWTHLVVWPILQLAREVSELEHKVRVIPLQTVQITPKSLLPQLSDGTVVDKKIDYGVTIELHDDQIDRIYQMDPYHGISSSASLQLRSRPLFCFIEVKIPFQSYDPKVQLGVWTSATYTKWEQIKVRRDLSSQQELPILFGWTITGHYWHLHLMRQLPDGTRQITANFRSYDTHNLYDVYLILATLCEVMKRGNNDFRTSFTTNVLDLSPTNLIPNPASASTSSLALAPGPAATQAQLRTSPRRQAIR